MLDRLGWGKGKDDRRSGLGDPLPATARKEANLAPRPGAPVGGRPAPSIEAQSRAIVPAPAPAPAPAPGATTVASRPAAVPDAAAPSLPVAAASDVAPRKQADNAPKFVTTVPFAEASEVGDVGAFRSVVTSLVPDSLKDKAMVLDVEYSSVIIVSLVGTQADALYRNIVANCRSRNLQIAKQLEVNQTTFNQLREIAATKGSSKLLDDERRGTNLYEDLIRGAFELGGTDLHIRLLDVGQSHVMLRLFGRVQSWKKFDTPLLLNALAAGFQDKSASGTNSSATFSHSKPTNTMTGPHRITIDGDPKKIMGRLTSYPTNAGAKMVIRLLETETKQLRVKSMEELGYSARQKQQLAVALRRNSGLIYLAGGTGSGKSTSLRTLMYEIPDRDRLSMYSVEDPVEYLMPWVDQFSIQRSTDEDPAKVRQVFLSAMRSLLRLDPDVVMVGEVRDRESASIASEMVQTGHRLLTTIHGDGVVDALSRMTDTELALRPQIVAGRKFLSAGVYQKLLPMVCQKCRIKAMTVLPKEKVEVLRTKFKLDAGTMWVANKTGCENCRIDGIDTGGTKGQTMVAEVLTLSEEMRMHVKDEDWPTMEKLWRGSRTAAFHEEDTQGKTAFEHALYKCSRGLIDLSDIEADFTTIEDYEVMEIK